MKKRMMIMIIALTLVFGGIFTWNGVRNYFMKQYFASFEPPPSSISATDAVVKTWRPYLSAVGTFNAVNGVELSAETSGIVVAINFNSGQRVEHNMALIQLNDKIERADLKNYQAELSLATINYQRELNLFKKKVIAGSTKDQAQAKLRQAEAMVERSQAKVDQKNIRAPFAGKVGIRKVNLGEFVSAGTELVSIQALDPLYLEFSLPEQYLPMLFVNQAVEFNVDAYQDQKFNGIITALNAKVNPLTRNILIQATLSNPERLLVPGMFANVKVMLTAKTNVVTLPQTAIAYSLYGDSVFVIESKGKDKESKPILRVTRRYVKVGERRKNEVEILEGVKAGESIVTSGQLKLENNTRVIINNSINLS